MDMEYMAELLAARLMELQVDEVPGGFEYPLSRELAYVKEFCGVDELDEELSAVCVELAAADILRGNACADSAEEGVKSLRMGDVAVGYTDGGATDKATALAERIYRRAIGFLAGRRRIRW